MSSIDNEKASLFINIASYLREYSFVECTFVFFIIAGYFIDVRIDSHLNIITNRFNKNHT
jgi:hypothetical protein